MQHQPQSNSGGPHDPADLLASQIIITPDHYPIPIPMNRPQNAGMETQGTIAIPSSDGDNNNTANSSSFVGMRISSGLPFPFKLHAMLDNASGGGYEAIVSWSGDNGFLVHDKDAFVETIIPKYFSQTKYRSFQRLLNMWGFQRLREGPRKGAYYHDQFQRGNASLCGKMKCEKIKKKPGAANAAAAKGKAEPQETDNTKETGGSSSAASTLEQQQQHHQQQHHHPNGIMEPPLPKILDNKKVVTFDKATKPGAVHSAPLPTFEDTFGDKVKQIIPVGRSKKAGTAAADARHPHADVFDPNIPSGGTTPAAPLPTYTDLFEDRQFHEVSKGDKIARVYGPPLPTPGNNEK